MPDDPEKKAEESKEGRPEEKREGEAAAEAKAGDAEPAKDAPEPTKDASESAKDTTEPAKEAPKPAASKAADPKPVPVEARSYPEDAADRGAKEPEPQPSPPPGKAETVAEPTPHPSRGAAWGKPLAVVDRVWSRIESSLCAGVLLAEVFVLVSWISIHGLSTPFVSGSPLGGVFFRCLFGAAVLGGVAHFILRPKDSKDEQKKRIHTYAVTGAVIVGLVIGPLWGNVGVVYFQNLKNWLDTSSVLFLLGGLGGLVKRLTIWLALLGASLATQNGKHIHFDLGIRRLPPASRMPVVVVGGLVGALVCFGASAGFLDEITVSHFNVTSVMPCAGDPAKTCDKPGGQKFDEVTKKIGTDVFLLGRQMSLDLKMLPRVLSGDSYKDSLTGAEWNEWMHGADWKAHFPPDAVDAQDVDPQAKMVPSVPYPGGPELPYEVMLREANLIFPFGFLMIGLRLVLRVLLILSGHIIVDPDAAHAEDEKVSHGGNAPAPKEAA